MCDQALLPSIVGRAKRGRKRLVTWLEETPGRFAQADRFLFRKETPVLHLQLAGAGFLCLVLKHMQTAGNNGTLREATPGQMVFNKDSYPPPEERK